MRSGIPHADDNQLGGCGGHSESFHLASTRGASKRGASGSYISRKPQHVRVRGAVVVICGWGLVDRMSMRGDGACEASHHTQLKI